MNKVNTIDSEYSQDLGIGLLKSLSLHLAFFIFIAAFTLVIKIIKPSIDEVEAPAIIESSVKVDVVGMPKLTVQELKKLDLPALGDEEQQLDTPKPIERNAEPAVSESESSFNEDSKKPKKNLNDLLSRLSNRKLKLKPSKSKNIGNESGIDKASLNKLILEGNKISKGSSLTGVISDEQLSGEFSEYALKLPQLIRPFWKLPTYLIEQELKCRVRIFIDSSGKLTKSVIYESSGNNIYDSKALEATKLASPFPPPPESIVLKLSRGDVILGFPL